MRELLLILSPSGDSLIRAGNTLYRIWGVSNGGDSEKGVGETGIALILNSGFG